MTDLASVLRDTARRCPQKTAVVAGDTHVTYAALAAAVDEACRDFVAHGVRAGDRVVVSLENGVAHVVALFALWRAGAVTVLVNPAARSEKLAAILRDAEATAVVAETRRAFIGGDDVTLFSTHGRAARFDVRAKAGGAGGDVGSGRGGGDALAALLYTSGSSGAPKGVMHSHASLLAATSAIAEYLAVSAADVVLQVLPLSFGYGLTQLLTTVMAGGTLALERGCAFPQLVLQRIAATRATGLAVVPTTASLLLDAGLRAHDLSSLRYVTNAGAAMAPALSRRWREAVPHAELFLMYGQTECIRGSYLPPGELARRPTSVGRGIPRSELWLVDDDGDRVEAGVGELVIRGPQVMLGYWKRPEETARKLTIVDGERTLRTGDLFRRDEDGFLHFVARMDDVIKTRGEKVSPQEVEAALVAVAGVAAAAVVGVEDALLGQAVHAFVEPSAGAALDARALRRACAERLEEWAVPKRIEILDVLPRNENGKIDKRAVQRGGWTS